MCVCVEGSVTCVVEVPAKGFSIEKGPEGLASLSPESTHIVPLLFFSPHVGGSVIY